MTANNTLNEFYTVSRIDSPIDLSIDSLPSYGSIAESRPTYSNFLGCNTEFVNFTCTYVNGSIRSADITPLDNVDLLNAIFLPALLSFDPFLTGGAATTATVNNVDSAIENWIDTLHKYYLALAALAIGNADNIDQQERCSTLAARIPKAPLFTLGMLLVLSILFNSFILIISFWGTNLRKAHPKQTIISIAGLTANTFDSKVVNSGYAIHNTLDLFEELKEDSLSTRIGISKNLAGGHHFVAFATQLADVKEVVLNDD